MRFDGGHKRDQFLTDTLASFVERVPVCPEMEMGRGAQHESMRLPGDPDDPRLVAPKSGLAHTAGMNVTLANRHLRRHDLPWVKDQVYLVPHPIELMLRNHV